MYSRARPSFPVASAVQTHPSLAKQRCHKEKQWKFSSVAHIDKNLQQARWTLETWIITKLCYVSMFKNPRQPVPVTDTDNFQNDSYGRVRIVLTQKRSNDEDTQTFPAVSSLNKRRKQRRVSTWLTNNLSNSRERVAKHP